VGRNRHPETRRLPGSPVSRRPHRPDLICGSARGRSTYAQPRRRAFRSPRFGCGSGHRCCTGRGQLLRGQVRLASDSRIGTPLRWRPRGAFGGRLGARRPPARVDAIATLGRVPNAPRYLLKVKRLKGLEPSTFCVASRAYGPREPALYPAISQFCSSRRTSRLMGNLRSFRVRLGRRIASSAHSATQTRDVGCARD
jgi:hypothetical protein